MRYRYMAGLVLAMACGLAHARATDAPVTTVAPMETLAKTQAAGWTFTVEAPRDQPYTGDRCDLVATHGGQQVRLNIDDPVLHCAFFTRPTLTAGPAAGGHSMLVFMDMVRGGDGDHTMRRLAVFELDGVGLHKLGEQAFIVSRYTRQGGALTGATGNVVFALDPLETGDSGVENASDVFVPATLTPGCDGLCVKPDLTAQQQQLVRARFARKEAAALAVARTDHDLDPAFVRDTGREFRAFMSGRPLDETRKYYMTEDVALRRGGVALELVSSATLVGKHNRYSIAHLLDGNPATTWATTFAPHAAELGPNGLFKIVFRRPVAVKSLRIWNGLQSSRKLFFANQRVKTLRVALVGVSGHTVVRTFRLRDRMGSQTLKLRRGGYPARIKALVFAVRGIYPGKQYSDLCISELAIGY